MSSTTSARDADSRDSREPGQGEEHDWEWRRRIRANPKSARLYRIGVGVLGAIVLIVGIVLLPFPGPGWLVIFLGLGIWASEFERAQRLLGWVHAKVQAWWDWLERKGWWAQALAGLATFVLVVAIFWAMFAVSGVPGLLPDFAENWLDDVPGLSG